MYLGKKAASEYKAWVSYVFSILSKQDIFFVRGISFLVGRTGPNPALFGPSYFHDENGART